MVGGHLTTVSGTTRTTCRRASGSGGGGVPSRRIPHLVLRAHDVHRAFGLGVLTPTATGISRIVVFAGGPALVARCGLPDVLSAERGRA